MNHICGDDLGLFEAILIISLPGMVGGFISAVLTSVEISLRRPRVDKDGKINLESETSPVSSEIHKNKYFYIGRSIIGLGGAFGVIMVGLWLGKVTFEDSVANIILLTSVV